MEKFKKEKSYTYEEIKKIIETGIEKTVLRPVGKAGDRLKEKRQTRRR